MPSSNSGKPDSRPSVVFCVAAYNAAKTLPECLAGVARQNPSAILVVDDGSTDGTAEVATSHEGVEVVRLEQNSGVGAGRNAALERLPECDYVAIVDSDIELEEGWLETLLSKCDWNVYSAACGRIRAADAGRHWAATLDESETSLTFGEEGKELDPPWREVMYFNYLFQREVFEKVGEFDPRFRTNAEDSDYFYRCSEQGIRFAYVPEAGGLHRYPPPTFAGWLRKNYRNGYYTIQFHLKHKTPLLRMKAAKLIGALVLVAGMAICAALGLFLPLFVMLDAFLLIGFVRSMHLRWKPVKGGWIGVCGWLAKSLGELVGAVHSLREPKGAVERN